MSRGIDILPYNNIPRESLVAARLLSSKYGDRFDEAAHAIVQSVRSQSIKDVYNTSLEEQQKFIQQAHPCVEQEIAYRNKFFELMTKRFKDMYQRHKTA